MNCCEDSRLFKRRIFTYQKFLETGAACCSKYNNKNITFDTSFKNQKVDFHSFIEVSSAFHQNFSDVRFFFTTQETPHKYNT